jgi:uncharacterized protein
MEYFKKFKNAIVALSGGPDSSYLLYLAKEFLGKENLLAATAINAHVFKYEIRQAENVAKLLDIKWIPFEAPMEQEFFKNNEKRCYYCKKSILKKINQIKKEVGFENIFDGSNIDDLNEFRPGREAIKEFGVISPLLDLSLSKKDILKKIEETPLKTLTFYTESCKATRLVNIPIDYNMMDKIEQTEDNLRGRFKGIRIRYNGEKFFYEFKGTYIPSEEDKRFLDTLIRYL